MTFHLAARLDFNPRTPCGVRRAGRCTCPTSPQISIHAPRVGCDEFNTKLAECSDISIHAPRVGCDVLVAIGLKV